MKDGLKIYVWCMILYAYVCMCVYVHVHTYARISQWRSEVSSVDPVLSTFTWILGIEVRYSVLHAKHFIHQATSPTLRNRLSCQSLDTQRYPFLLPSP